MHRFVLVVGSQNESQSREILQRALAIGNQVTPPLTECTRSAYWLPELGCGWCFEQPANEGKLGLLGQTVTEALSVLVFGEVEGTTTAWDTVHDTYSRGGIDAVSQLNGNFFAVIADRRAKQVHFATDLLGQRGPVYRANRGELWVSNLSLLLIATGLVPLDYDPISAASILAIDWSLGGKPLLSSLESHDPNWRRVWTRGRGVETRRVRRIAFQDRIARRDATAIRLQQEKMLDTLRETTRVFASTQKTLRSNLTAGLDSRALTALLASVPHAERWVTVTSGATASLDVRIAARLARAVGIEHERNEPEVPTAEDFEAHAQLRAVFCNGDSNAKQALNPMPAYRSPERVTAGGTGGEIFRGFFYPYFGPFGIVPNDVSAIADTLLRFRFRRIAKLPFASPDVLASVRERLVDKLAEYQADSPDGADILDLFYVFERYGRWGSASSRCTWSRSFTPFSNPRAIAQAFHLPSPIGRRSTVMELAIRRYLPRIASLTPVNGGSLVFLSEWGMVGFAVNQALALGAKALDRATAKRGSQSRSVDELRADAFRTSARLRELTADLLLSPDALIGSAFTKDGLQQILEQHHRGKSQLQFLGFATSIELWRRSAEEAARLSRLDGPLA